jgi:hypothetical protein
MVLELGEVYVPLVEDEFYKVEKYEWCIVLLKQAREK